jgi:hypothetical protein
VNSASNNGGAWRKMEKYIRDDLKKLDPTATFRVVYTGKDFVNGRPSSIDIKVFRNNSPFEILPQHNNIPNP